MLQGASVGLQEVEQLKVQLYNAPSVIATSTVMQEAASIAQIKGVICPQVIPNPGL